MTQTAFKNRLGITLVMTHFAIILYTLGCYFAHGFHFDELTTSISLMAPLFASYTTVIIRDMLQETIVVNDRPANSALVFITFFLVSAFGIYLFVLVSVKAFNLGFGEFDQFKILLAISETVFGVYIGQIISSTYKGGEGVQPAPQNQEDPSKLASPSLGSP
jgi:hypothetical protein